MDENSLEKLGYDEWFRQNNAEGSDDNLTPARVIEVNKNSYVVSDGEHEMPANLSGKFIFESEKAVDLPTVGDWVRIQALDNHTLAVIHFLLPRKTLLKRKKPGKQIDFQLIAANIDFGLIVQSAERLNLNSLDRYLVMLNESRIQPIAVFSKIDLLSSLELAELKNTLSKLRNQYLLISNVADGGVEELSSGLLTGRTYCLLGPSGAGKSSLLNNLLRKEVLKVNTVREKDGRGRHTTVRRQLIRLESGSLFIDTPGMRELGNFKIEEGLDQTFDEFLPRASKCRFRDCTHTHEEGCAIIEAVKTGEIEEGRYKNYLKIRKESEHYEMLYQERRKKDKAFGRMVKNYQKNIKKGL